MNPTPRKPVDLDALDPSKWPQIPRRANKDQRPKRRYLLTPEGLNALRTTAARNRPWTRSTGPRTPEGRAAVRLNSLKHGNRTAEAVERRRMFTAGKRECERRLAEHDLAIAAEFTIVDLARLLKIGDDVDLLALTGTDIEAAAERVGVDLDEVVRWMNRRLAAKTLAGALRFAPPKPKKRPPPPPPDVEIQFVDTPAHAFDW